MIKANHKGNVIPSYTGKYLLLYDEIKKQYEIYNHATQQLKPFAKDIPFALYDEENDVPDDANAYGIARWMEDDQYVLLYDRYDVWKVDPTGKEKSVVLTNGRKEKVQHRYIAFDEDEKYITPNQDMYFRLYHEVSKTSGLMVSSRNETMPNKQLNSILLMKPGIIREPNKVSTTQTKAHKKQTSSKPLLKLSNIYGNFSNFIKAKEAFNFIYTMEDYQNSANLYLGNGLDTSFTETKDASGIADTLITPQRQLSFINPQQEKYNWGTAELFQWKAYTGKLTEGVLYKPEDFDAKKNIL